MAKILFFVCNKHDKEKNIVLPNQQKKREEGRKKLTPLIKYQITYNEMTGRNPP